MDELLASLKDLKINRPFKERLDFYFFKKRVIKDVLKENHKVLVELKRLIRHHTNTLKHNILVAYDTEYIAKKLGLDNKTILSLTLAGFLHDIGKLDIHEAILDIDDNEIRQILKSFHNTKDYTHNEMLRIITLRQAIMYKAKRSDDPSKQYDEFLVWINSRQLSHFLDKPILDYFRHHQNATKKMLKDLGFNDKIIEYASNHHQDYFDYLPQNMPIECKIIEIADKFNGMLHSDNIRHYFHKKNETEALDIIFNEIKNEFSDDHKRFSKKIICILAEKYIPHTLAYDLIPKNDALIKKLRKNVSKHQKEAIINMIALITMTMTLAKTLELNIPQIQRLERQKKELTILMEKL